MTCIYNSGKFQETKKSTKEKATAICKKEDEENPGMLKTRR